MHFGLVGLTSVSAKGSRYQEIVVFSAIHRMDSKRIWQISRVPLPLKSATLHYTTEPGLRSKRVWQSLPAEFTPEAVIAPRPPADANTWFIALTDQRDAMVTSSVQFRP